MKIALLSDVHDYSTNLLIALHSAMEEGCEHLIYLGDIVDVSTLKLMLEEWPHGIDIVFGNNEYDLKTHVRVASARKDSIHHGYDAHIERGGRRIYCSHFPHEALAAAESGKYHAAFFGHTHRAEQSIIRGTLLANPGEVAGIRRPPSYAVFETETLSLSFISI